MGRDAADRPRVEIRLAGVFTVTLDGAGLTDRAIGSRKSRTLLKLLAVRRPGLVSVEQIADVLWDGAPPEGADRNIASLVSRLRAVLGPGVIGGGRAGYRLGGAEDVSVDLDTAARLCDQADRSVTSAPSIALAAAERAVSHLAGEIAIADEPYASWVEPARVEQRQLLRRARLTAAQAALGTAQAELASRYAEAAIAADDLDEAAYRWYMAATAAGGERARALRAYADLRQRLAEELGTDPAPQTRDLHLAILREESSASGIAVSGMAVPSGHRSVWHEARGQLSPAAPVLVGRDSELAVLRAAWMRAADREPSMVLIVGDAGIGKTTLAEVLAAEVTGHGATVLQARCYETERSLFLQPIVEAVTPVLSRMTAASLRELLGGYAPAAAALVPAAAQALGPAPPGRGSAQIARRRAFETVTTLLRGLADRDPVLLFIDDLQYAGQSTVELLHFIGRQLAGSRTLIVTTVRAEHSAEIGVALDPVAVRLDLGPLADGAVEQLADQAGQGTHAAEILARTRGHTLFVVEVLRALRSGDTGLPESLRAVVQGRVERAGQQVASLLRAASVLGATVDPLTVGALLDLPAATAVDLCEQALRGRLLAVSGRDYEFANDLIREVLYATTPEPSRLVYHRRAADLLARHPESLARHAAAAGDWPRAARAWLLAADEALTGYATSDAVALAAQALDAANQGGGPGPAEKDAAELRARALVLRGRAREAAGDLEPALADLIEGARLAHETGDRRLELHALRQLGGDASQRLRAGSSASLKHGLAIAESLGDYASQADLLSRLVVVAANRLRLGTAIAYGEQATSAGRAAMDERALASGLDGLKLAYLSVGDVQGLTTVLAELLPLVRRQPHRLMRPWVEFEAAFLAVATADLDRAAAEMTAAMQLTGQLGYPQSASWFTAHLGWLARLRGDYAEATELGLRAVQIAEQHDHGWWRTVTLALLGQTVLMTGDRTAAIGYLERGAAAAHDAGIEGFLLRCLASLAEASGSAEVLTEAAGLLDRAEIPAGRIWLLGYDSYLSLARAWLNRDEPHQARLVLAPLIEVARREPWITALAAALAVDGRALLRLGQRSLADEQLQTARLLADEHGLRPVHQDVDDALLGADLSVSRDRCAQRLRSPLLSETKRCSGIAMQVQHAGAP